MSRERIAAIYEGFARLQAKGRSAVYEGVAGRIAQDEPTLAFLARLPPAKWQPNLFLAAVHYVCGRPGNWTDFRNAVAEHGDRIAEVMLTRTTQTNQPARCATLLPALAALPQPLALLEVGASAGLCLLPDRYGYDFDGHVVTAPTENAPVFRCRSSSGTPLPQANVEVVWRAGLDLNPLDLTDTEQQAWLDALIWTEEQEPRHQLRAAIDVALADPPPVRRGDLRTDLPALAAQAPRDATLVVFHTAVLAYIADADERASFAATVKDLGAVWLANETAARIPGLPADLVAGHPLQDFLLCQDGRPLARTDPHGTRIDWL